MLRDVVAPGPSKSRRTKTVDGYVFPRAMLMLRVRPAKQELPLSKQTAMNGVMVVSQRKAAKGACTVTQAARDRRRLAAVA